MKGIKLSFITKWWVKVFGVSFALFFAVSLMMVASCAALGVSLKVWVLLTSSLTGSLVAMAFILARVTNRMEENRISLWHIYCQLANQSDEDAISMSD